MSDDNLGLTDRHFGADGRPSRLYNDVVKRFADLLLASVLAVVFLPLMVLIAVLINLDSPGGALYRGIRTGYNGQSFRILKFRSMVANAENLGGGTTALNDPRITRVGRFIRKTKMDELPQLFNIIFGQMSFIGPRPELPIYTDQFEGEEKIILSVRPGITDLSSLRFIDLDEIVGESNADEIFERYVLKEKNRLRIRYVREQSLILDIRIFLSTIWSVARKALGAISGMSKSA